VFRSRRRNCCVAVRRCDFDRQRAGFLLRRRQADPRAEPGPRARGERRAAASQHRGGARARARDPNAEDLRDRGLGAERVRDRTQGGRRDRDRGGAGAIIAVIAIALAVLTPLIAGLIQLAVSRQREYLADASGALLTRYPPGLASALRKIAADKEPLEVANKA